MLNKTHFATGEIPEKALKRIDGRFSLEPEEQVILFYNLAILRFGAAGIVFTNRRAIRYDTKNVASHPNEEIQCVSFENLHKMNGTAYLAVGDQRILLGIFDSKDFKEVEVLLGPYVPVEGEGLASERELQERVQALGALASLPTVSLTLDVPVNIATGGTHFAKKLAWGMVTRGLGAVSQSRYFMNAVRFPETCCHCGILKGRKGKYASFVFRQGNAWTSVVGMNPDASMSMQYRVCEPCAKLRDEAVKITNFRKDGDRWLLTLGVRNPDVARRIGELNVVVPDVLQS